MTRRDLFSLSLGGAAALSAGYPRAGGAASAAAPSALADRVREAERAFARTMAVRDPAAFAGFVSEEGVFLGEQTTLRGRAEVAAGWRRFFEGPTAPFSWEPERVEVLASGGLGFSSGPVFSGEGTRVGTFNSVWRLEADGRWRVVFDKGCPPCRCP
jgi:ketosteroid isomerase-like protein